MITYKEFTSQDHEGEYDTTIIVYQDKKEIGFLSELTDGLKIEGDFTDFKELETSTDGVPDVKHDGFELSVNDLLSIQNIVLWWCHDGIDEPIHLKHQKGD